MAILSIEGVPLPVQIDSLRISGEPVGEATRNVNGYRVSQRRREKLVLEFSIAPRTLDEAMMYRTLILGEGEYWSMGSSQYGGRGHEITGTGAWESSGGNPYYTNGAWALNSAETMIIPGNFYDQSALLSGFNFAEFGATVIGWRSIDSTGAFRAFGWSWRNRDSTPTVKREALGTTSPIGNLGTPQAYTGNETFAVVSQSLRATAVAGDTYRFSGLRVLPWYLKSDQIDLLLTGRNLQLGAAPAPPMLYVQSDLFPVDNVKGSPTTGYDSALIMHGEIDSMPLHPSMWSGSYTKTIPSIEGRLIEV